MRKAEREKSVSDHFATLQSKGLSSRVEILLSAQVLSFVKGMLKKIYGFSYSLRTNLVFRSFQVVFVSKVFNEV